MLSTFELRVQYSVDVCGIDRGEGTEPEDAAFVRIAPLLDGIANKREKAIFFESLSDREQRAWRKGLKRLTLKGLRGGAPMWGYEWCRPR